MKALIRRNSDPILETMNIPSINWNTGAPLTNPGWYGGPYILVNDYVPEDPDADFAPADPTPTRRKANGAVQAPPAQAPAADGATYGCTNPSAASQPADAPAQDPTPGTIVIDGVTYTRTS